MDKKGLIKKVDSSVYVLKLEYYVKQNAIDTMSYSNTELIKACFFDTNCGSWHKQITEQ